MSKIKQSIGKSAVLVTAMMLCFKLLGFIKQAVIAYTYGATLETDVYFVAWGFVSGLSEAIVKALLISLVAIYTHLRIVDGKGQAEKLVNGLLEVLIPIFSIIVIFIFFLAPILPSILAPYFDTTAKESLIKYIRILSPILLFGAIELVFGAIMDSHKSFYIPRLQSLIYSLSVIIACLLLSKIYGVHALVIAQYFSSVCFGILLFFSVRKFHKFAVVKIREIPELKNIIVTSIPLFIGNSALQINQIVDKSITSGVGEGATSALSYCHTLEQFVTNIMIVNVGNVIFANFAELVAKNDYQKVSQTLSNAINTLIALLAGVSVITIVCAKDIVAIVYYRGSFTYHALELTSIALIGYAVSFVAVAVRDLSVKSLYAFKDTKSPMIASVVSIFINIIFSLILSKYIGILGISLATTISAIIGMILNAMFFKKHIKEYEYSKHLLVFIKCIPGMVVLLLICITVQSINLGCVFSFLISSFIGLPIYYLILMVFHVDGTEIVKRFLVAKMHKKY